VLRLERVSRRFGSLAAVDDVSLTVERGARHALIGPNGAGKTTLLNLVAGVVGVTEGRIYCGGRDITALPEHRRVRLGIAKTFQRSSLFDGLSVRENVAVAVQRRQGVAHRLLRPRARYDAVERRVEELLEGAGLSERAALNASELAHGERRQLEISLAMACEPEVILLDEPAAGMSAAEREAFAGVVERLPREVTLLLIEHDIDLVFRVANVVSVMRAGSLIAQGSPKEVSESPEVQESYLGSAHTEEVFLS
jgi:branched-chain amino acid transport system ATP-binding protein